jgi:quinoprotein glucose dehydrogenase
MRPYFLLIFSILTLSLAVRTTSLGQVAPPEKKTPDVDPSSHEGEVAIARFRLPPGFKAELFAAEPLLANPVAFCIDERGRFYVAESFRRDR